MAQIIKADGTIQEVQPKNGNDFKLAEMNEIVGGYIEIINAKDGRIIIIDEEGKLKNKPFNEEATKLYIHGLQDPIVGDVLVCNQEEVD